MKKYSVNFTLSVTVYLDAKDGEEPEVDVQAVAVAALNDLLTVDDNALAGWTKAQGGDRFLITRIGWETEGDAECEP